MRIDKNKVAHVDIANGKYICIIAMDAKVDHKDGNIDFIGVIDDDSLIINDGSNPLYQEDFELIARRAVDYFKKDRKLYDNDILIALKEQNLFAERIMFNESVITYSTNTVTK